MRVTTGRFWQVDWVPACAGMTAGEVAAFTDAALIPGVGGGRIMGPLRSLRVAPWKRTKV